VFRSFQGGRYKVTKKLGEGGKGIVFEAEDTRLGRTVAIKVIKGEGLDQESFTRFEQEAKATASLSHPNIAAIYDIGQEGESHYLVLEFIDGPNLGGLIRSQPGARCDAATTLRIGSQVCQALEYAHSHGILHRDIKPENVMITSAGVPKLMDFGLARALGGPNLTQRGVIVGTPAYLPPEQALGKRSDTRSDLYSLGCVLYEMVTGRPPFHGDDPVKVIFSHINDLPVMPRKLAPDIPDALEQVILKLLVKDPDQRYQSASELLQAFKSVKEVAEARPAPAGVPTEEKAPERMPTPEPRWAQALVDREQEMKTLRTHLDAALRGEGSLVFITGEAGIGKTRLAYELRSYAKLRGAQYLMSKGGEREGAVPYQPWSNIINEYVRWAPPLLVFKAVGTSAAELAKLVPELGEKLGTIPPSASAPGAQEHVRLYKAVAQFFINISRESPLALFLDDLQWFDDASMALLHHMARAISAEHLLVVGAYRDLELDDQYSLSRSVAEINRERLSDALPLKRLAFDHVLQMVSQTFGEKVPGELPDLVYAKTEGNPFFVEEVVRSLVEEGAVYPVEKGWGVRDLSQVHVPRGIKEVLGKKLESLDEESSHVLGLAAVVGREFSFSMLREVTGLDEDRLIDIIDECLQARLVVARHIPGEEVYAFADTQLRDVLYEGISPVRRRRHHLKVGEAMEKAYAGKIDDYLEALAYHFLEGNDLSKAGDYAQKAGDKAAKLFAWDQARRYYETALELMEKKAPMRDEELINKAQVLEDLAGICQAQMDYDAALGYAKSGLELSERLGDKQKIIRAQMRFITIYTPLGREDLAHEHLEATRTMLEEGPDSAEKGMLYQRIAHVYLHLGQPATAVSWAQKAVDIFAGLGVPMGVRLKAASGLGTAWTYTGRVDEGIAYNEDVWIPVIEKASPLPIGGLGQQLTLILTLLRDIPRARKWGEQTLPEATRFGIPTIELFLRRPLALLYALSGEVTKAQETCQAVEEILSKGSVAETGAICPFEDVAGIGFHYLRQGEWDKARHYLEEAIAVHKDRSNLAAVDACSLALGSLSMEEGNLPEAEGLLLKSLEICRKGGNVLFELWVLPVLAELHLRMGQPDKAAEYVDRGFELMKPDQSWYGLPAPMYLARGMLAAAQNDWDTATDFFDKAIQINRQYQLPWDEAKTLYERGLMYLARGGKGDRDKAHEDLDEALAIFQKVGASKDVEKVLRKKEMLKA
jgi:serine/threonine protein kinase/tetratricopeptide (TPR) repeat protein